MCSTRFFGVLSTVAAISLLATSQVQATPKVILISLDGAEPSRILQYLTLGVLPRDKGLGLLASKGLMAKQNVTTSPSLTAVGHIAIATGASAARNDIVANTFHLLASPINRSISGFAAPIGGYSIDGPIESADPTAEPMWLALRAAGRKVVAATWPGADGATITAPGITPTAILQKSDTRTVDYTVPYGSFAGPGATGFVLTAGEHNATYQINMETRPRRHGFRFDRRGFFSGSAIHTGSIDLGWPNLLWGGQAKDRCPGNLHQQRRELQDSSGRHGHQQR
ncbi:MULTISPECIES: alkaline phosphatase family protein [Methylococcus]|uniref:Alkaline phosphatase family protein n=1 Tax=Methylococcus capsulatus TaxID=414 RepID=A0ABZ2F6Z5_METCP|nr:MULTISPECIES: alkaline phosphatase family protein [Methylococcus]